MPGKKKSHNQARKKSTQQKSDGPLHLKEENQEYALVVQKLGDRYIRCMLKTEEEVTAVIPGKFYKRVWVDRGNIILLARRGFQTDKLDIVGTYSTREVRKLYLKGEIPKFFYDGERVEEQDDDIEFGFEDGDVPKSDINDDSDIDLDGL